MNKDFYEKFQEVLEFRESRDEIVEYFQQKYPGVVKARGKAHAKPLWKEQLASRLSELTGISQKNLERRFEKRGDRRWQDIKPSAKQREQYKELGKLLPPIMPPGGFHIYGTIYVQYSEDCAEREFDEIIYGGAAEYLVRSGGDIQVILNLYNDIPVEAPGASECPEQESILSVEPIY